MIIGINDIESGMYLNIEGEIYLVQEYHHVKPGKGAAFVRVKLKSLKTDNTLERTYRTAEKLEQISMEERDMQYLYRAGEDYSFMDHSTYEQISLSESEIGDGAKFLLENLEVMCLVYNHKVLKVVLPNFIVAKIIETEPGIRGDSSRAGTKPAKIETGATVLVPLFVSVGEVIKIDTRTGSYVERVQR